MKQHCDCDQGRNPPCECAKADDDTVFLLVLDGVSILLAGALVVLVLTAVGAVLYRLWGLL